MQANNTLHQYRIYEVCIATLILILWYHFLVSYRPMHLLQLYILSFYFDGCCYILYLQLAIILFSFRKLEEPWKK